MTESHQDEPRVLLLHGDITEELARDFMEGLLELASHDPLKEIVVYIDTYGGSPYSMFAMHDMMRHISCPIYTVGVGKIMSAGVLLLAAGDRRSLMPNAVVMLHQVSSGIQGKTSGMQVELDHLTDIQTRMYRLYSKYTKKTIQEIKTYLADTLDKFMTAQQAKEFGIVDEIVEFNKDRIVSDNSDLNSSE
jgi:ATP-dependent Clp protease protease subunit